MFFGEFVFPEFGFDVVEPGEVTQEPACESGALFKRFIKAASDVGHAGGLPKPTFFGEGEVRLVGVVLEDAAEVIFASDEVKKVLMSAPSLPLVVDADGWIMKHPEVAFFGPTVSGGEVVDGRFVSLQVVRGQELRSLKAMEWLKEVRPDFKPMTHE